ncbi:hypothetical protein ACFX2I_024592 [Malus domestica]
MFHSTLEGNTMKWYANLPSGSITDFKTLSKDDESLRDYIKRFCIEFAQVDRTDDSIASSTLKKRIPIKFELRRKLHKLKYEYITLAECFDKAEEIIIWYKEYMKSTNTLKMESTRTHRQWKERPVNPNRSALGENRGAPDGRIS